MDNINLLLTDEFITFSGKIAQLHAEKKKKKQELKAFYDKIQAELGHLDDQAKAIALEFEDWKRANSTEDETEEATT
jgi:iron-sulfur cluster repair protein YtfE (RIC family)